MKKDKKFKNPKVPQYVAFGVFVVLCFALYRGIETGFEEY